MSMNRSTRPHETLWVAVLGMTLLGCGHMLVQRPPPGTRVQGTAKVLIAHDVGGSHLVCSAYQLTEEHTVVGEESNGLQHLTARLVAAEEGESEQAAAARPETQTKPCEPDRTVGRMVTVLRDVTISFDRSCRGEVSALRVDGRASDEEKQAAQVLVGYVYGDPLGAVLPGCDQTLKKGAAWTGGRTDRPLQYRYRGSRGALADIATAPGPDARVSVEVALDRKARDLNSSRARLRLPAPAAAAPAEDGVLVEWKLSSRTTGRAAAGAPPK